MKEMSVVTIGITVLINLGCVWMLFQEKRKINEEFRLSKKFYLYGAVMLVCNGLLAAVVSRVYVEHSVLFILKRLGLLSILWIIAPIDYRYKRIPNWFLAVGAGYRVVIFLGELIWEREVLLSTILSEGIAFLMIGVILIVCLLIMKNSMGAGDIKLMLLMCLFQGIAGVAASLFCSMLVSFVIAVFLLLTKKKNRKDTIPFGPCVLVGTYLSIFLVGA